MDTKEFEALISKPGEIRYEYFIKKIADYETIWGLYDNGWASSCNDEGKKLLPLWPKKEFATYCAINEWLGYAAKEIDLQYFLDKWTPSMKNDKIGISILSNNIDAVEVEPEKLERDILAELENY